MASTHVSKEDVEQYSSSIRETSEHFNNVSQNIIQLDEAIQELQTMIADLDVQDNRCKEAIEHLNSVIQNLENQLRELNAELAVTPPTIPETYEDENGAVHTVMVPNPAYYAILDQIKAVQNKLDEANTALSRTIDVQNRIRDSIQRLKNVASNIGTLKESITYEISVSIPICQSVLEQLQKIGTTIDNYTSVVIGATFDQSHNANLSKASFPTSAVSSTINIRGKGLEEIKQTLIKSQGKMVPDYHGTCGPCTMANALRLLGIDKNERETVQTAITYRLCRTNGLPNDKGSMSIREFVKLGKHYSLESEVKRNPSMSKIKKDLEQGNVIALTVNSGMLRNPISKADLRNTYTDHFVTVTGVNLDSKGNPVSIEIWDTGRHSAHPNTTIDIVTFERMKSQKDFTMISLRKR